MTAVFPPSSLKSIAEEVGALLKERKETVSVAEITAGGLISAALLSVPGASSFYLGGVNVYQPAAREAFLGVTRDQFGEYDGPTEQIVLALASRVQEILSSTWGISEGGIAGPTLLPIFRSEIDSPGYCPIAISGPDGYVKTKTIKEDRGTREDNMVVFATEALKALRDGLVELQRGKARP